MAPRWSPPESAVGTRAGCPRVRLAGVLPTTVICRQGQPVAALAQRVQISPLVTVRATPVETAAAALAGGSGHLRQQDLISPRFVGLAAGEGEPGPRAWPREADDLAAGVGDDLAAGGQSSSIGPAWQSRTGEAQVVGMMVLDGSSKSKRAGCSACQRSLSPPCASQARRRRSQSGCPATAASTRARFREEMR